MEPNTKTKYQQRRKATVDLNSMMYGKVPPQAKELEEAVLGAIMLDKSAFDRAVELLTSKCFYSEANQRIFAAMQGLAIKSLPIDLLTVVEELKNREELDLVGGPYYVTKLTNSVTSSANIEHHSRYVYEKFVKRELIRISGEIIGEAYEDGSLPFDLLDAAEKQMYALSFKNVAGMYIDSASVAIEGIRRTEDLKNRDEEITGVPSGFTDLDRSTAGWQNGDLIVLAARPSVGKTAFALNLARNAATIQRQLIDTGNRPKDSNPNVGFFCLEMSNLQLSQRIAAAESGVPLEKITRGRLDDAEMKRAVENGFMKFGQMGIFWDDSSMLTLTQLRTKARKMVKNDRVGLIIIDYLQLMNGQEESRGNREQEISMISRGLKKLAKELHIPIIALSQLSREVEKRKEGNQIPQLSDLRDSGAIEQDADVVMFLYRPEYYNKVVSAAGDRYEHGETHVRIAKHRNGTLELVKLKAQLWIQKFSDFTPEDKKEEKKNNFVAMEEIPFPEVRKTKGEEENYNFNT